MLRLAVGAQVLVAQAVGDLEVALEAGHHQQLLELLRRLRQRVELARLDAAGHEVVAGALRRRRRDYRRLHLDEVSFAEEVADELHDTVAHHDVAAHAIAAQVQVAILEAQKLLDVLLFGDVEGRRARGVQNLKALRVNLDLARRQVRVFAAFFSPCYWALDPKDVLASQLLSLAEGAAGLLRVDDDLNETRPVAEVDEDEAAVVSPAVYPAGQRHRLAVVRCAQQAAGVALEHNETTIPELRATHSER